MNINFIENRGPDNLRDALRAKLREGSEIFIAVAFVTQPALDKIIQLLKPRSKSSRVRLLTGLYQSRTEPRALRTLLRTQSDFPNQFCVRLSRDNLHSKVYLIEANKNATIFIGSSNLTVEGLESGGELNLMLSLPKTSDSVRRLKGVLEKRWEDGKRLNSKQIDLYERFRPAVSAPTLPRSKLKVILGSGPKNQRADREKDQPWYWRDAMVAETSPKTDSIVCSETDWDKKRYWWNSEPRPHPYKRGHQIFLFDIDNRLKLVNVLDKAKTSITTPDGKRFIAWKPVKGYSRKLTQKFWNELRSEGILKKNANRRQKVSLEKAMRLKLLLKKTSNRR